MFFTPPLVNVHHWLRSSLCPMSLFRQVFARIVERQATNVVRGGFGMLNVGQAFPALADVLDVVSPPPSSQRYA